MVNCQATIDPFAPSRRIRGKQQDMGDPANLCHGLPGYDEIWKK